jgi:hypothetical protein
MIFELHNALPRISHWGGSVACLLPQYSNAGD